MTGFDGRVRRRRTIAERRDERAQIVDGEKVVEAAARFLETRSRSTTEVRRRLVSAGYRPELVEAAITRLVDLEILDDAAFARAWIESRDRARPRGEHALRRELSLKGVDRATIEAALVDRRATQEADRTGEPGDADAAAADPDEIAAERVIERHARALDREPDPRRRRQKAYALLARNGFSPDVAAEVSRRAVRADSETDD
ncbi:MAG: regulatory protein RecX [Chloroflexota bacterium]